jgi:cobalt-zinc-cadmium efflux system outer membrane protein
VRSIAAAGLATALVLTSALAARAQGERRVSLDEALREARGAAPDLVVARARESVARADVGIAGVYPNPSVAVGTSTQAAKVSGTVTVPLVVLGQRGAAVDAARADQATVALDTQVAWVDVRQAATRAYVTLWLAEGVSDAKRDSAAIAAALEGAVIQRVEVGAAPQLDALRVHAEKLRADAEVLEAAAEVSAAGSELGRWMGVGEGSGLRAARDLPVSDSPPTLASLLGRVESSATVRRERSDVRASEARAARERALVRPGMALDLGLDAFDPTLLPPGSPSGAEPPVNYRAQITIDLPLFNQRGAYVERENALGDVARARVRAAQVQGAAELTAAYHNYEAATAQQHTLADAAVPAARLAAKATEDAYALGRAQLVAVLDAERTLVDVRVSALAARAARANAWADVEHALGMP